MQDYPEDGGAGMSQVFHGKKILLELPSPNCRDSHDLCQKKEIYAIGHVVEYTDICNFAL